MSGERMVSLPSSPASIIRNAASWVNHADAGGLTRSGLIPIALRYLRNTDPGSLVRARCMLKSRISLTCIDFRRRSFAHRRSLMSLDRPAHRLSALHH